MKRLASLLALLFLTSAALAAPDPIEKIAKELADGIGAQHKLKVAVVGVSQYGNFVSEGAGFVSERLTTYLVKDRRFPVIERDHIAQILSELHLSETGVLDPASAKQVGKMLGADIIVTGSLIDLEKNQTEFNARALSADTGRILAASRAMLKRTWAGPRRLGSLGER
jgi:curli biogenesis system outer membrane secretion channel CsgG